MGILNRFPEQAKDRRGFIVVSVVCILIGAGFQAIGVPFIPWVFGAGGIFCLVAATCFSRGWFAWLQRYWYMFL